MGSEKPSPVAIVCIGANEETEQILAALFAEQAPICGVVTVPPARAGGISDYIDVRSMCAARDVPVVETADINDPVVLQRVAALRPTHLFLLGWNQLLGEEALAVASHGVFGGHPSALPFGRGRAPIPWTILQGLEYSAVSIFRATTLVDAGPIVYQQSFPVPPRVDARRLYDLCTTHLREGWVALAKSLRDGVAIEEREQDLADGTLRARRIPADGRLDFARPAEDLDRLIRAVTKPYPGAYAYFGDDRVIVWGADLARGDRRVGVPGQVLARRDDSVLVQAGDEPIWLHGFEIDGQQVPISKFALGSRFGVAVDDEIIRLRKEVARLAAIVESLGAHA